MIESEKLRWDGPFVLGKWITSFLDMTGGDWPPERPGVYVVSLASWRDRPSRKERILYVGCSETLARRIGDLVQVLLGFYSVEGTKSFGPHPGWRIRDYCYSNDRDIKVGDLFL